MKKEKITVLSDEQLEEKINCLEKKHSGIIKTNKLVLPIVITGAATLIFMFGCMFSSFIHGEKRNQVIEETSYNEVYEETLNEKLQSLENQLYSKDISPEEYIEQKKNAKGISREDYIKQYGTEEQIAAFEKHNKAVERSLEIGTNTGSVCTALVGVEAVSCLGAMLLHGKKQSTLAQLKEERKRRAKRSISTDTLTKAMEIEPIQH
ncbi:MAG: hypothetical protein J6A28_00360 [Clostridia bacterium]|nr:hypothetical protein [Clostridia bacterium]